MVTSKYILNIIEQWDRLLKTGSSISTNIYSNPDKSDLKEINSNFQLSLNSQKEIRFIADARSQKVYVWDSSLAVHADVSKSLGFGRAGAMSEPYYVFDGFGNLFSGKIIGQPGHGTVREILALLKALTPKSNNRFTKLEAESFSKQLEARLVKTNWTFVEKYVIGVNKIIEDLKNQYFAWLKT